MDRHSALEARETTKSKSEGVCKMEKEVELTMAELSILAGRRDQAEAECWKKLKEDGAIADAMRDMEP